MASEEQERFQEETLDEVPKTAGQNHEPDDAAPKTRQGNQESSTLYILLAIP